MRSKRPEAVDVVADVGILASAGGGVYGFYGAIEQGMYLMLRVLFL